MGSLLFSYTRAHFKKVNPRLIYSRTHLFFMHKNVQCLSTREGNKPPGVYKKQGIKQKDYLGKERQARPKSVFDAGTASRTAEFQKRKMGDDPHEDGRKVSAKGGDIPSHPLTVTEWKNLKENFKIPQRFEVRMMEKMLVANTDIDVAKSLLAFVAMETGTLSYELLLRYLTVCVHGSHHTEVFDMYDIMKNRFKTLDMGAYSLFVKGFSRTERWQECLLLLETIKKVITPSARNYADAINGAVQHGDTATGWRLYDEMMEKGVNPRQDIWQLLFNSGSDLSSESKLHSILFYMRENQIYPDEALARSIKAWFESLPGNQWKGSWATINARGVCQSCKAGLESIQLSEDEYRQLRDSVMRDVIEGPDVFNKTTPEELETFKRFVKRKPPFDVVIDGLNVANSSTQGNQSETLLAVVSQLVQDGLRVLVLGRKHMLRPSRSWDRGNMSLIQKKADCFFTENISEDDPFLLYAALHSGNHCKFVSRDLMRDHKACLPNSSTRRLFFKWQRGHQMVLPNFLSLRRIVFQQIPSYDTIIQTDDNCWHIPYDPQWVERCTYEVPKTWLCLTRNK